MIEDDINKEENRYGKMKFWFINDYLYCIYEDSLLNTKNK